jgi:enoyl-CoA hydratase/carnithine racemase
MSSAPASADGRIQVERRGALLLIGVDRPEKRNGFTETMLDELARAYQRLEDDSEMRVGVLHAFGDHFSAGLQLDRLQARFTEGRHLTPEGLVDPFQLHPPFRTKPVVAAMQGICFTVACELMLAADIVVAANDCRFAQLEVKRGIMANHGATIRMVERAGWGNAMRYLLTGDEFDAETAFRLGFVQEVVAPGHQLERAVQIAESVAAQAPLALAATLTNARKAAWEGPANAILELGSIQKRLFESDDAKEGVRSFVERRTAVFTGR